MGNKEAPRLQLRVDTHHTSHTTRTHERTNERVGVCLVVLLNDLIMMTRDENMEKTPGKGTRKLDPCTKRYKKKELRRT